MTEKGFRFPLPVLQAPGWRGIPHLVHGFCGRRGGVSRGVFAELNMSFCVGDDAVAVRENWRRVTTAIGGGLQFATMKQVHGSHVVAVDSGAADAGEADALVTRTAGVGLGLLTADCVPLLLVAPRQRAVAAVHAGWRGTLSGIARQAVACLSRMWRVEPAEVSAALGPAIDGCCYEVDGRIADDLERRWGAMPDAVFREPQSSLRGARPHPPKARIDLRGANAVLLARAGVRLANVSRVGPCTRCATTQYFSHRATSATTGHATTGRQLCFIGWKD